MNSNRLTRHPMMLGLIAGMAATLVATPADAQRWGRPSAPRSGACFYRDANFRGDYFCVATGEGIESVPNGLNDQISSIRTFGREVGVVVYQNRRFSGRSERFGDVSNLQTEGWNDRVSSLQVDESNRGFGRDRGDGGRFGNDDRGDRGRFGNDDRPDRGRVGNDPVAERIVRRVYQDVLGREPDPTGLRTYRSRILDNGWTEQQVREDLQRSPEARERSTMTPQRAADIVRRAYLSVLNREPDSAGSQGYVQRVLRDKWTEEDVARELRRSPEYRQQGRGR